MEPASILIEVIVHVPMCVCVCVCVCVCACECLHSWKKRAESLHLAVVSGVSAVIPLKRQTGSGTLSRKQEDFTHHTAPALELKKQAKSLQTPVEFT